MGRHSGPGQAVYHWVANVWSTLFYSIRVTGSAAVNMCLVASGQADAYYEYGIHCWDIAAGDVIVREAGGVCMMPNGEDMVTELPT